MHQKLIDFDEMFSHLGAPPLIANDFDLWTAEGKQQFKSLLMTEYDGDFSSPVPSCRGGHIKGSQNYGMVCPVCSTPCVDDVERSVEPSMWIKAPGDLPFVQPAVWTVLNQWFTTKSGSLLHYITDPTLKVPENTAWVDKYKALGLPRGLSVLKENFDEMLGAIVKIVPNKTRAQRREMLDFIMFAKDKFFCKYLPVPNQMAFIVEKNDYGRFADENMAEAYSAIYDIVFAEGRRTDGVTMRNVSLRRKEHVTTRAMTDLTSYYRYFVAKIAGDKEGVWRQHVFGTMLHWTARGVITSIVGQHHYQDCHLPWAMAIQLLKAHLYGKLIQGGDYHEPLTVNQAFRRINHAVSNYDELLHRLMNDMIADSIYRGIPITLQRNPSLMRGSAQLLYVVLIKTEVECNTIELSPLILTALNADFDGDALNIYLIVDRFMHDLLERLAPKYGAMDLNSAMQYSGSLNIPAPLISTIGAWLGEEEEMFSHLMEEEQWQPS